MKRVLDLVARVAPKDVTVLFLGESGSGKDVMAAALHAHSRRADKAFVRFNAAAIPAELAEAELFGHAKGAFTGAVAARQGYFQTANGGTLFIDEVGELGLATQAKLLRALQSGEVQPVGGRTEHVDVRLVAATNRDLAADVKAGRFREDLFYRLDVVSVRVPPLRERPEDIEPLARAFTRSYAERYGMGSVVVEPALLDALRDRPWPGNVRELENTIARLLAVAPGRPADARALSLARRSPADATRSRTRSGAVASAAATRRGVRAIDHRRAVRSVRQEPERDRATPRHLATRVDREAPQVRAPVNRRAFLALCALAACRSHSIAADTDAHAVPARIVSLSPSTTETVFVLGALAILVGRSRYCD